MDYNSDFFQKLQLQVHNVYGDEKPPILPAFEDEQEEEEYFNDYIGYTDWLKTRDLEDSIEVREKYFEFILFIIVTKNSPDYFAFFLTEAKIEILRLAIQYISKEISFQSLNPLGEFAEFLISAHAQGDDNMTQMGNDADDRLIEVFFNNRMDLFDFFISGIYSMFDYFHHPES